jgi:hypothetical protein
MGRDISIQVEKKIQSRMKSGQDHIGEWSSEWQWAT